MVGVSRARRVDGQRGSALIEATLISSLLLLMVLGAFEWGMALRNWVTVSAATREGARAAASAGSQSSADCRILEAASGALQNLPSEAVVEVWIHQSDTSGTVGATQRYRPRQDSDDPVALTCGAAWFRSQDGWPPAFRDDEGADRDWVGVRIVFDHEWQTSLLWFAGETRWEEQTVMRIEPVVG